MKYQDLKKSAKHQAMEEITSSIDEYAVHKDTILKVFHVINRNAQTKQRARNYLGADFMNLIEKVVEE